MVKYFCNMCEQELSTDDRVNVTFTTSDGTKKTIHLCKKHHSVVCQFIVGKADILSQSDDNTLHTSRNASTDNDEVHDASTNTADQHSQLSPALRDRVLKAEEMYKAGVPRKEIAAEMHVSYPTVCMWLRKIK